MQISICRRTGTFSGTREDGKRERRCQNASNRMAENAVLEKKSLKCTDKGPENKRRQCWR
jgi:hypothetical protein